MKLIMRRMAAWMHHGELIWQASHLISPINVMFAQLDCCAVQLKKIPKFLTVDRLSDEVIRAIASAHNVAIIRKEPSVNMIIMIAY